MKKFFKSFAEKFPKDWPTRIILGVILALALVGAIYGYGVARTVVSTNEIFSLPGDPVIKNTEEVDPEGTAQPTKAPEASFADAGTVGWRQPCECAAHGSGLS